MSWGYYFGGILPVVIILIVIGVIIYLLYKIAKKKEASPLAASIPEQIEHLAKLKDQGILSEAEFEEKKKELLSKL